MMALVQKTPALIVSPNHFCPGCGHGIVVRLLSEVLEDLGCEKDVLTNCGVGCSCIVNTTFGTDILQCAHGRASASATGMKRVMPEKVVLSYQGDGDAYNIGLAETLNAAYRKERITLIVINNGNFGMTGGQMSWTTLPGQKTTTSVYGRDTSKTGDPIHVPEIIASFFHPAFVARGAVNTPQEVNKLKSYIKNAVEAQINDEGYSMVEVLSPCPTNWGLSPLDAMKRIGAEMVSPYPLGILKNREKGAK